MTLLNEHRWRVFDTLTNSHVTVPSPGKIVHFIGAENDPCCAAEIISIDEDTTENSPTLLASIMIYDPSNGVQVYASGVYLGGIDGPFPNWHYRGHYDVLVPQGLV